jgi:hypothetical protein
MTDNISSQHFPQWMPTAGGVLSIVAGSFGLLGSLVWLVFGNTIANRIQHYVYPSNTYNPFGEFFIFLGILYVFSLVFDVLAIIGGIFAIQRKHWGWVLAGGISAVIASRIMGIVALVFIILSRKEFDRQA